MAGAQKAVFLDIDGTLITRSEGPFDEDLREIEKARNRGHRIFLNTGRSFANIASVFRGAPWVDGIVAGAGTHVLLADKNGGFKTIYHTWIPQELLPLICELYLRIGKWCFFEGETELYEIIREQGNQMIRKEDDFVTRFPGTLITKITMEGNAGSEERALLEPHFALYSQGRYSEGIIKGESKSKGMGIILKAVGLSREDAIAIGDSVNDMDMIRFAQIGVAMGNACAELKAIAAALTDDVEHGGVAKALRQWAK